MVCVEGFPLVAAVELSHIKPRKVLKCRKKGKYGYKLTVLMASTKPSGVQVFIIMDLPA